MNTPSARLEAAMSDLPLVAILRGLTPAEAPAIGYGDRIQDRSMRPGGDARERCW
jgi:hypothetical protein